MRRLARYSTGIGVVIGVLGAVFVARAIVREGDEVRNALANAEPVWLLAASVLGLAGMTGIGLPWRHAMRLVGGHMNRFQTLTWYFIGQLGKYVPGGLWPVVGRAELARRGGVGRPAAYGSVALSLGATYLAAVMVVGVFWPFDLVGGRRGAGAAAWILGLLPLGLALLHPAVAGRLLALVERLTRRRLAVVVPAWGDAVRLVGRHVPSWLAIGTATWCVARAFGAAPSWTNVVFAAVLSWVIGFVVVPVPGGLGVREAAFVAAATSLPDGVGATTAVTARMIFMLVDAFGAAGATLATRRRAGEAPTPAAAADP